MYYLFVALELNADRELTMIFMKKSKGLESFKRSRLDWLCDDEEVQFIWCLISLMTIEEESVRQKLLHDIAFLWITTRAHNKVHRVKEDHKRAKAGFKEKRSLRKQLVANQEHSQ